MGDEVCNEVKSELDNVFTSKTKKKKAISELVDSFFSNCENSATQLVNSDGDTILHLLASRDHANILKWLIARHPSLKNLLKVRNGNDRTADQVAETKGCHNLAEFLRNPDIADLVEQRAQDFVLDFVHKYKSKIEEYKMEQVTGERKTFSVATDIGKFEEAAAVVAGQALDLVPNNPIPPAINSIVRAGIEIHKDRTVRNRQNKVATNIFIYDKMTTSEVSLDEVLIRCGMDIFSCFEHYLFDNFTRKEWESHSSGYRALAQESIERITNYIGKYYQGQLSVAETVSVSQMFLNGFSKNILHSCWRACKYSGVVKDDLEEQVYYRREGMMSEYKTYQFGFRKLFEFENSKPPEKFCRLSCNPWNTYDFRISRESIEQGVSQLKHRLTSGMTMDIPMWSDADQNVAIQYGTRPSHKNFIERKENLKYITSWFSQTSESKLSIFAIQGFPGVGKSVLASQYLNKFLNQEVNIIWLNGKEGFQSSFWELYNTAIRKSDTDKPTWRQEKLVEACYRGLPKKDTLIVFGHAESWEEIEPFVLLINSNITANPSRFEILITSPSKVIISDYIKENVTFGSLMLDTFTKNEALIFLNQYGINKTTSSAEEVSRLIKRMHGFPLVLHQICTYIENKSRGESKEVVIKNLLQRFSRNLGREYDKECVKIFAIKLEVGERWEVYSAVDRWRIIFEDLQEKESIGEVAVNLVKTFSFLAYEPIDFNRKYIIHFLKTNKKIMKDVVSNLCNNFVLIPEKEVDSSNNNGFYLNSLIRKVVRAELANCTETERDVLGSSMQLIITLIERENANCDKHIRSVWRYALSHEPLVRKYLCGADFTTHLLHGLIKDSDKRVCDILGQIEVSIKSFNSRKALDKKLRIANIRSRNQKNTPLHVCIKYQNVKALQIFLEWGTVLDRVNRDGLSPIHLCAQLENPEMMRIMLKNGNHEALLEQKTNKDALTPLLLAAKNNHEKVALLLIKEYTVDVGAKSENGFTVLDFACQKGLLNVARLLLSGEFVHNFGAYLKGDELAHLQELMEGDITQRKRQNIRNKKAILKLLRNASICNKV